MKVMLFEPDFEGWTALGKWGRMDFKCRVLYEAGTQERVEERRKVKTYYEKRSR